MTGRKIKVQKNYSLKDGKVVKLATPPGTSLCKRIAARKSKRVRVSRVVG